MRKPPTAPDTRRRSAAEWREIIDRWTHSGLSAADFARKNRLSERSLTWWRWRLRAGSASSETASAPADLAFVPLVASSPRPSNPAPAEVRWVLETEGVRVEMAGATAIVIEGLSVALTRVLPRG